MTILKPIFLGINKSRVDEHGIEKINSDSLLEILKSKLIGKYQFEIDILLGTNNL